MLLKRSFLLLAQRTIALVLKLLDLGKVSQDLVPQLDGTYEVSLKPSVLNWVASLPNLRYATIHYYRGAARSATNELGLGHAAPREA